MSSTEKKILRGYITEPEVLMWWWWISFFLGVFTEVKGRTDDTKSAQKYELPSGLPHPLTSTCASVGLEGDSYRQVRTYDYSHQLKDWFTTIKHYHLFIFITETQMMDR